MTPPPTPAGQPYRDSSQVGVRAVRVLAPGDFTPAKLTAYFDRVHSPFRPTKIAANVKVAATYSAPGQPDVTQTHEVVDLPDDFTVSELLIDGVSVALPRKGNSLGSGIAPPAVWHTVEVSWLVGGGLLDFLAEKRGDLPDGYSSVPRAVEVEIVTIFYGPMELPRDWREHASPRAQDRLIPGNPDEGKLADAYAKHRRQARGTKQ